MGWPRQLAADPRGRITAVAANVALAGPNGFQATASESSRPRCTISGTPRPSRCPLGFRPVTIRSSAGSSDVESHRRPLGHVAAGTIPAAGQPIGPAGPSGRIRGAGQPQAAPDRAVVHVARGAPRRIVARACSRRRQAERGVDGRVARPRHRLIRRQRARRPGVLVGQLRQGQQPRGIGPVVVDPLLQLRECGARIMPGHVAPAPGDTAGSTSSALQHGPGGCNRSTIAPRRCPGAGITSTCLQPGAIAPATIDRSAGQTTLSIPSIGYDHTAWLKPRLGVDLAAQGFPLDSNRQEAGLSLTVSWRLVIARIAGVLAIPLLMEEFRTEWK